MVDKILAGDKGVLLKMYDGTDLARDAIARFPALKSQLVEADERIHALVHVLGRATLQAVREEKMAAILEIWSFLEQVLSKPRADSEIENAVCISFVNQGELVINSTGRQAADKMPVRLRRAVLQTYPPA